MADFDRQKLFAQLLQQTAQTAGYRMPNEPDERRGLVMTALDYLGRPYSAGTGAIVGIQDALWAGGDPADIGRNALRGLTGEEDYSGSDIVSRFVDPYDEGRHETAKRWGGLAYDLGIGWVYDPLSYLTFGSGKVASGLQKAKRGLDVPIPTGALKGLTKWPGRTEAAKRGASAWSVLRAQADIPFIGKSIDIPLTPKAVNVPVARALDWTGQRVGNSQTYQAIRRHIGGWRYLAEKKYEGLADAFHSRRIHDQDHMVRVVQELDDMAKNFPEQAQKAASYISEMPQLAKAEGPVAIRVLQKGGTPEDQIRYIREMTPYVKYAKNASELHTQRTIQELRELKQTVKDWKAEEAGYRIENMEDVVATVFPGFQEEQGSVDYLLELMIDQEQRENSPEKILYAYLVQTKQLPEGYEGMPEVLGFFGKDEYDQILQKTPEYSVVRVPVKKEYPVLDASGKPVLDKKGRVVMREEVVYDPKTGQPKMRKKRSGGHSAFLENLKRAAAKKKRETGLPYGVEFAGDLARGNVATYVLYRHPGYSSLADPLKRAGGVGSLTQRQARLLASIEQMEAWAKQRGNTLRMSEALVAKDQNAIKAILKEAGLPDSQTNRNLMEAVHLNIWAGNVAPGRYADNLRLFADDLLAEEFMEPAQRFAHQQKALRHEMGLLEEEKAKILAGKWDPPRDVVPDVPETTGEDLVQRWEESGIPRATSDKPHGIYTTPANTDSPFSDLGGARYLWKRNPNARILDVTDVPGASIVMRQGADDASAGVAAVKRLLGDNEFTQVRAMSLKDLREYAQQRFPGVDWARYTDKQEVMEGIGGMLARDAGYDAIVRNSPADTAFSEYVGLTDNAMVPHGAIPDADDMPEGWLDIGKTGEPDIEEAMRREYGHQAFDDEPAPLVQAERLAEIEEQLDRLRDLAANPDPFDKAMFLKSLFREKTKRHSTKVLRVEEVAGRPLFTDEVKELLGRGEPMLRDSEDWMMAPIRAIDPNAKPPIDFYLPHIQERATNPLAAAKRSIRERKKVDAFLASRRQFWAAQGIDDALVIDEIVKREAREQFGLDTPWFRRKLGYGQSDRFLRRSQPWTLFEMNRAGGWNWEERYPYLVNEAVRERYQWRFGYDMYDLAKTKFGKHVKQLSPAQMKAEGWVPIGYYVPFLDPAKNPFKDWYIPKELDDLLQNMMRIHGDMTGNAAFNGMLDVISRVRQWWSQWTLLPFMPFHVRNLGSDLMLSAQAGTKPHSRTGWYSYRAAADLMGRKFPGAKRVLPKMDWIGKYMDELRKVYPKASFDDIERYMRQHTVLEGHLRDVDRAITTAMRPQASTRAGRVAQTAAEWMPLGLDTRNNKILQYAGRFGQGLQDYTRSALFFDQLLQNAQIPGLKIEDALDAAVDTVRRTLFDYQDLTAFEQRVMKNLMPFYTFSAKNLPRQFEVMLTQPRRMAYLNRAYNGLWNTDDDVFEREMIPEWLEKAMGVPIRRRDVGNRVQEWVVWSPQGWIPMTEVNELANSFRSFSEAGSFWFGRLNPVFKEPLEQIMNMDSFTGRAIDNGEIRDVMGIPMHPRIAHLVRNIRLVTDLDRLNPGGVFTKLGQARGWWRDQRPHRREAPESFRYLRGWSGTALYQVRPVEEMQTRIKWADIDANTLRRRAQWALRKGQIAESRRLMRLANQKQSDKRQIAGILERYRQGRAREMERRQSRKVGAEPE